MRFVEIGKSKKTNGRHCPLRPLREVGSQRDSLDDGHRQESHCVVQGIQSATVTSPKPGITRMWVKELTE